MIKIGKRIEEEYRERKPEYRLIISTMHGDGDMYTDEKLSFANAKDCYEFYKLFNEIKELGHDGTEYNVLEEKYGEDRAQFLAEVICTDITSSGDMLASIESVSVEYYDENGNQYEVKVT